MKIVGSFDKFGPFTWQRYGQNYVTFFPVETGINFITFLYVWPAVLRSIAIALKRKNLQNVVRNYFKFVLVISWLRGKFGINFPRYFIKLEISRAKRGKFNFVK